MPQASHLHYGGSRWHALAQAAAEITALKKGYRSIDASRYRDAGFQPDLVISRVEKFRNGPRVTKKEVRYAIEIVDSHAPVENYARKAAIDDILLIRRNDLENPDSIVELLRHLLLIRRNDLENPDSIVELFRLCQRVIP